MKIYVKGGIVYWLLEQEEVEDYYDENVLTTDQELGLIKETNTEELLAYLKTEDGVVPLYPTNVQPEIDGYWLLDDNDQTILTDNDEGIWVKWQYSFAVYSETDNSLTFYTGFAVPKVGDEYKHKVVTAVYTGFEDTAYTSASSVPWNSYRTSIKYVRFEDSYIIVQPTATAYWFDGFTSLVDLDVSNLNTSNTTSYSNFATGCTSLKSVTISSRFTLFSKSSQLVDQMTWYDIDKNQVSYNYLISFDKTEGTYWNDIYAIPAKQAIAIYSASDNSLTFYYDYMPTVGTVYNGKVVTALYYDFSATNYNSASEVPWASYATSIKKVIFDSSYYEVQTYTGFGHDEYYILDGSTDVVLTDNDAGITYRSYLSTAYWFSGFTNCTSFDLTGLYTATITNMQYMFYGCTSVTSLDLSGFDTSNVSGFVGFLLNCDNLEEIIISDTFDLFAKSDKALVSQQYWHDADITNVNDYLIGVKGDLDLTVGQITWESFAIYSVDDNSLIFYYDNNLNMPSIGGTYKEKVVTNIYTDFTEQEYTEENPPQWHEVCGLVQSVSFDESFAEVQPLYTAYWFYEMANCTSINTENLDTSQVKDMHDMFSGLESLEELNVNDLDVRNVTTMYGIFYNCSKLTTIDISNWQTDSLTDAHGMFDSCSGLITMDVSNLDTSKVTDMDRMFYYCESLQTIYSDDDVFVTTTVTSSGNMFTNDINLVGGNGTKFDSSHNNHSYAHVDVEGNPGYFTRKTGFAVYSEDDNSLTFYSDEDIPNTGTTYNGKSVTNVYTGFETKIYTAQSDVPWYSVRSSITSVTFDSSFSNIKPTSTAYWFIHLSNCTQYNLTYLNTSDVTTMNCMFYGNSSLTSLDVSMFDTSRVTNLSSVFTLCSKLTYINLNNWDTSKVTDFSSLFDNCSSLTDIIINKLDTSNATNLSAMFYGIGATTLDVSSFDTSKVTNLYLTFAVCSNLTTIYATSGQFVTTNVTTGTDVFTNSTNLVGGNGTKFSSSNTGYTYAKVDTSSTPGYFTDVSEKPVGFAVYSADDNSLTFYEEKYSDVPTEGSQYNNRTATEVYINVDTIDVQNRNEYADKILWYEQRNSIDTVTFDSSFRNVQPINLRDWFILGDYKTINLTNLDASKATSMISMFDSCEQLTTVTIGTLDASNVNSMQAMFQNCYNLTTINITDFKTSKCTDMSYMFYNCSSLTSLDTSTFDVSNVTTMHQMFCNCSSLTSLDVSNFNTSNVTTMRQMFHNCSSLTSLDVSNLSTSNVTTMYGMFEMCEELTSLDLRSWDVSNVTDMAYMFNMCYKLTSINIDTFNTSKVTSMYQMFNKCYVLKTLDVSTFDTSNVEDTTWMFSECEELTSLSTSNWKLPKTTSTYSMFNNCSSLTTLDTSNFDLSCNTDARYMFYNCVKLNGLDVSKWSTGNITSMYEMFCYCSSLTSLSAGNWDTSNVTNMQYMFEFCSNLTSLDVSGWDTSKVTTMQEMFYECNALTTISVGSWNTNQVTTMYCIFYNCTSLSTLNISNWNTSNVTDMAFMFRGCSEISSLDVSGWDVSKVTNMHCIFWSCSKITSLDVSGWKTSKVTDSGGMFEECTSLKTIYSNDNNFSTSQFEDSQGMFYNCTSLVGGNGTKWTSSNATDKTYAHVDTSSNPGYFTAK